MIPNIRIVLHYHDKQKYSYDPSKQLKRTANELDIPLLYLQSF